MKTRVFLLICIIALSLSGLSAQHTCLPGGIKFTSQSQIDSFHIRYPQCTEIEGDVIIEEHVHGNIMYLDSLYSITTIHGDLKIGVDSLRGNLVLQSLNGLNNLMFVEGDIAISGNKALNSLRGLGSLKSVGGSVKIGIPYPDRTYPYVNPALNSLVGLAGLHAVDGDLVISSNASLMNLNGLEGLTTIGGHLRVIGNDSLSNLGGLERLISIGSDLDIFDNKSLTDLGALANISSIEGNLDLRNNRSLKNLSGLDNVVSVRGRLSVRHNSSMTNLKGLENLRFVGQFFTISNNIGIQDLRGLEHLTTVGWGLYIEQNRALKSLDGLERLTTVGAQGNGWNGFLFIIGNNALTDLGGLQSLSSIGGGLYIGNNFTLANLMGLEKLTTIGANGKSWGKLTIENNYGLINMVGIDNLDFASIDHLNIQDNISLEVCNVLPVCTYIDSGGPAHIAQNAPRCGNRQKVEETCHILRAGITTASAEEDPVSKSDIYPNPTFGTLYVRSKALNGAKVVCYTASGARIMQFDLEPSGQMDISSLANGCYILEVDDGFTKSMFRVIKQ